MDKGNNIEKLLGPQQFRAQIKTRKAGRQAGDDTNMHSLVVLGPGQ